MNCSFCGGNVTWRGPFSSLTHTECSGCGAHNSQIAEQDQDDHEDDEDPTPGFDETGSAA